MIVVLSAAFLGRSNSPSGYSDDAYIQWQEGCEWIRDNTAAGSLIHTPRESVAFKWLAERAEYVCYKDCPQDAAGILEWHRRLETVAWLDPNQMEDRPTRHDMRRLLEDTGVTHVITRWFTVDGLVPVFENPTWRVYDLSDLSGVVD